MKKLALIIPLILIVSGCATNTERYHWGEYENLVYLTHIKPGEAPPEMQIEKLLTDKKGAAESGKEVPPGLNAHLGMMYAASGNLNLAIAAFEEETAAFPESKKFIDDMIARAKKEAK